MRNITAERIIEYLRRMRWGIAVIFLLISYWILGLEGEQVLVGLSCRNGALLILSVLLFRRAVLMRRKHVNKKPERFLLGGSLVLGSFFAGAFLFLQANVVLDTLVGRRDAILKNCVVHEVTMPGFITGYNRVLTGVNTSDHTKSLPLTRELTERALDELDRREQVHVIFYEHVRRVILLEKTEDIEGFDFWQ